jgi:hypothetical protein
MSKTSRGSAPHCPTCPGGRCPSINTTPQYPEPDSERVSAAEQMIPLALAEEFRVDERHEALASKLADILHSQVYGKHFQSSAEWAIHRLIERGLLSAHATQKSFPPAPAARRKLFMTAKGFIRREHEPGVVIPFKYGKEPAPFDTFVVRAENLLWRSSRSHKRKASNSKQPQSSSDSINGDKNKPELPKVDVNNCQVRYKGQCHDVTGDAALLFKYLIDSYSEWFSASSKFAKPSAIKSTLPPDLKALIETQKGKGYRLKLAPEAPEIRRKLPASPAP